MSLPDGDKGDVGTQFKVTVAELFKTNIIITIFSSPGPLSSEILNLTGLSSKPEIKQSWIISCTLHGVHNAAL